MVFKALYNLRKKLTCVRKTTILWGFVGAALLIRIGFIILIGPKMEAAGVVSLDAYSYHSIAQNLVERRCRDSTSPQG